MSHTNISGISRILILLSLLVFTDGAFAQGSISDTDLTAGATTNYTYNFTVGAAETLLPTEVITVTFPSAGTGFDVSNVLIAGSTSIDGGFTASPSGQNVIITRDGTGTSVTNQTVEITFGVVTNPTTIAGSPHTISLSTLPGLVTDNTSTAAFRRR